MSKPIAMIFTDVHLQEMNCQEIKTLLTGQGIDICKQHEINLVFCLGDVFDSRISQKQSVLVALDEILETYNKENIVVHCLRGNHDSSDYKSRDSFLKPYKHYPTFNLIDDIDCVRTENVIFGCIAFYNEDIWIKRFEELEERVSLEMKDNDKMVCLGHMAITGSKNLGHVTENSLNLNTFAGFDKVFLGHYHDHQELSDSVVHLGSLSQNNFGEDENKGFWLIYDDLTYELIPSEGKRYKKEVINLKETTFSQVDKIIKTLKKNNPNDHVRVELVGSQDELNSIDKEMYRTLGVDIKTKAVELENNEVETAEEIKALTNEDIIKKFEVWCQENKYEITEGVEILKQVL